MIACFFDVAMLHIEDEVRIQQGENPSGRSSCSAETAVQPCNRGKWLGKLLGILQHGLHIAQKHVPTQNRQIAKHGAEHIAQIVYQIGDGIYLA